MEYLVPALTTTLTAMPMIIVYAIGIAIAISRRRQHPGVSLLAILALTIQIFLTVATRISSLLLPLTLKDRGWSTAQIGQVFFAQSVIVALLQTAVWIMVVYAIFGWRAKPESSRFAVPPPPSFRSEHQTSPTISQ